MIFTGNPGKRHLVLSLLRCLQGGFVPDGGSSQLHSLSLPANGNEGGIFGCGCRCADFLHDLLSPLQMQHGSL